MVVGMKKDLSSSYVWIEERPRFKTFQTFSADSVTREVHPTERVDVGSRFVGEFATNFLTPSWRSIPMFRVNPINESVQWLGVPDTTRTDVLPWTDNILDTSPA